MNFEPEIVRAIPAGSNLIPLVNVVFLLLIFVLLVGTLAPTDPLKIQPPASDADGAREFGAIELGLSADGQVSIDGKTRTPTQIDRTLTELMQDQSENSSAVSAQIIEIKADHRAQTGALKSLLRQLQQLGFREVRLITVAAGS